MFNMCVLILQFCLNLHLDKSFWESMVNLKVINSTNMAATGYIRKVTSEKYETCRKVNLNGTIMRELKRSTSSLLFFNENPIYHHLHKTYHNSKVKKTCIRHRALHLLLFSRTYLLHISLSMYIVYSINIPM